MQAHKDRGSFISKYAKGIIFMSSSFLIQGKKILSPSERTKSEFKQTFLAKWTDSFNYLRSFGKNTEVRINDFKYFPYLLQSDPSQFKIKGKWEETGNSASWSGSVLSSQAMLASIFPHGERGMAGFYFKKLFPLYRINCLWLCTHFWFFLQRAINWFYFDLLMAQWKNWGVSFHYYYYYYFIKL